MKMRKVVTRNYISLSDGSFSDGYGFMNGDRII